MFQNYLRHRSILPCVLQVIAAVYGPRVAENRSQALYDRAIVKCEYAEAAFSTGELQLPVRGPKYFKAASVVSEKQNVRTLDAVAVFFWAKLRAWARGSLMHVPREPEAEARPGGQEDDRACEHHPQRAGGHRPG